MSNKTADSISQIQNSSQEKNRKLCAVLFLAFFFAGLIPVFVLGTYNHPTGDDYYYGVETHHIWESSHNLFAVLAAAYEAEYQDRLRQLMDPKQQVIVFLPYQHPADLLYVGDLGADPDSPNNQRTAEYFHKESICVKWYN